MTDATKAGVASGEIKFRSNSDYHRAWNGLVLVTTWRDGSVDQFDLSKVHADNRNHAAQHGFEQRLGDSTAIELDAISGKVARLAAKQTAYRRLVAHYESGVETWNMKTAAPKGPDFDLIAEAVARWQAEGGREADVEGLVTLTIKTAKATDRNGALLYWADSDKVKAAIAAIKAERAPKPKLDADAELAAMMGQAG